MVQYPTMASDSVSANSVSPNPVPIDPVPGDLEPNDLARLVAAVQRRQLVTPLLLLLASHQPLTFVMGQLLYALAPLGSLLGWEYANAWAAFFSAPDANRRLTTILAAPPSERS